MEVLDVCNGRLTTGDTLYSQVQRIYLKFKNGEEKCMNLRVNVELKSGMTISSEKILSLLLTDDNDCTFYYSLLLTQEDFRVLKAQQGLLLDFGHFPAQLVKLLDVCRSQELPKFILVLDEEETEVSTNYCINNNVNHKCIFFKVIETNNFKNLCHLSLKVIQGSDSDIKRHMSSKISSITEKLVETEKKCNMAESNLAEALKMLEGKTKELSEVQLKLMEEKSNLKLETSHQISEEREKFNKLQMEWQKKSEMEKSQLEGHYQRIVNDLNEQISLLTFNNKNLYEGKCQSELAVKEKNFQIETLEKQAAQYTQELTLLRKQNSQLDQDLHDKEKALIGLKTKLVVAEQEIKDKMKLLEKQQELWRVANEQKTFLEESLNERDTHLQRKQITIQNMSADLMKSNEIITKLQTEMAAIKSKLKLRTDIALEQEKVLEKKTQEITTQSKIMKELEDKVESLTKELNCVKSELLNAKKEIEEKEVVIKKNDNVINWLNRRLTESSNSSGSIPSARSEGATSVTIQAKSNLSNLTRGYPPWLTNSISGNNSSTSVQRKDPGEAVACPTTSSTPVEPASEQPKSRLPRSEGKKAEPENGDNKAGGLDPKYFQECIDIEGPKAPLPRVKYTVSAPPSRPGSSRERPPFSAYFPRKTVQLQSSNQ